ncbi:MAG: FecR family protein [Pirellulales bacterium]|nr:FecR family protein [Pirellulales bacterium]
MRHEFGIGVSVAAAFLLCTLAVLHFTDVRFFAGTTKNESVTPPKKANYVAQLVDQEDVTWLDDTRPALNQRGLVPGQRLAISDGLLDIRYLSGARVIIEGPAEYFVGGKDKGERIKDKGEAARSAVPHPSLLIPHSSPSNSGFLALGKLVARVDSPEAHGFTIQTPTSRVVDLGTEFAVEALSSGRTRLHVFEGAVHVFGSADSSGQGRAVAAGSSLTVSSSGHVAPQSRAAADQFVRVFPSRAMANGTTRVLVAEDFTAGRSDGSAWISAAPGDVIDSRWVWSSTGEQLDGVESETWIGADGARIRGLPTTYDHDFDPSTNEVEIPGGAEIMSNFPNQAGTPVTIQVSTQVRLPEHVDPHQAARLTFFAANRTEGGAGRKTKPRMELFNVTDNRPILASTPVGRFGNGHDSRWNYRMVEINLIEADAGDVVELRFSDTTSSSSQGLQVADVRFAVTMTSGDETGPEIQGKAEVKDDEAHQDETPESGETEEDN